MQHYWKKSKNMKRRIRATAQAVSMLNQICIVEQMNAFRGCNGSMGEQKHRGAALDRHKIHWSGA